MVSRGSFLKKVHFRLQTKYSLQIVFIIVLVSGWLTIFAIGQFHKGMRDISKSVERLTEEALYEQMQKKAEVIITTLSKDVAGPFYYSDIQTINTLFKTIKAQEGVVYVYLYDSVGKIVTEGTNGKPVLGKILADEVTKKALLSKEILMQINADILDVSMPISMSDQRLGGVRVGFSLQKIKSDIAKQKEAVVNITEKNIRNTLAASIMISMIFILLGMFFALRIARVLARPILKLREAAQRISKGDLTFKVDIKSGDELEELSASFNQMTADLYNHKQELTTLHSSAKSLTRNLEVNTLLEDSLNTIKKIIKASKGSIMLLEGGVLLVKGTFGWKAGEVPGGQPFSIGEGVAGTVAKEKESIIANDVNNHPLFKKEGNRIWRGCRDLLCVPMVHEGRLKGVINIQDKLDGKPFTKADLEYAEIIASYVALSLANIEYVQDKIEKTRMEAELKTAETVQKTLFPQQDPRLEEIELASFFESATETGGDWFGYIYDEQMRRVVILIGDVSGHGVSSALVTAAVNSFVKTLEIMQARFYKFRELFQRLKGLVNPLPADVASLIEETLDDPLRPANILKLLNRIVLDIGKRNLVMTFFVSVLDLNTKALTFANAGHIPPYFYRKDLSDEDIAYGMKRNLGILGAFGMRLGEQEKVDFTEQRVQLKKGDIIFWFTDGLVECENEQGEGFGERRLTGILKSSAELSAPQIKNEVTSCAYNFFGSHPKKDDVAFIVAKIN